MQRILPLLSLFFVLGAGYFVYTEKNLHMNHVSKIEENIGNFTRIQSCVQLPKFLKKLKIKQPVMIDLSQKRYKGIALLHGQRLEKVLHPKRWEQYENFSTYALDREGNIFLAPMPFISIKPTTFNLQKNIYKLHSDSGKLEIFMHFDDVLPSPDNPYGVNGLVYDCDDNTLWVSAIDETSYKEQKGLIYHVDLKRKKVLQKVHAKDALSLSLVKSTQGKYLLAGAARSSGLYAYKIETLNGKQVMSEGAKKLLELPNPNEHIRKIKVTGKNTLALQTIPFSYSLIAQTAKKDRLLYDAAWDQYKKKWSIIKH